MVKNIYYSSVIKMYFLSGGLLVIYCYNHVLQIGCQFFSDLKSMCTPVGSLINWMLVCGFRLFLFFEDLVKLTCKLVDVLDIYG